MSQRNSPWGSPSQGYGSNWDATYAPADPGAIVAAFESTSARTRFLQLTYLHLAGAVALFVAVEAALLNVVPLTVQTALLRTMAGSQWSWLIVMFGFMAVSWVATSWAQSRTSPAIQYAGLALYAVAEAVIFLPLMFVASKYYPDAIPVAGALTGLIFGALTLMVLFTSADFSWLGRGLMFASFAAIAVVVGGMIFGFSLGLFFIGLMIALASGYILYHTSEVLHRYDTTQHVAAALALFASLATLFFYVLQLVMSMRERE